MLYNIKRLTTLVILSFSITLLVSCAPAPVKQLSDLPVSFKAAIVLLTNNLLMQVKNKQGMLGGQKKIVLEPFIDMKSNQVVKVSRQIEEIIYVETHKKFGDKFIIERLTPESVTQADYVMHGVILYDAHPDQGNFYHVKSTVIEKNVGKIVAKSDVWISNKNLDYTPLVDNPPVVIPDSQSNKVEIDVMEMEVGAEVPQTYQTDLGAGALMTQAGAAYEKQDYQTALDLFTQVTQQQSLEKKKMMKAYIGLYRSNIHLGEQYAAEEAFGKLVALSVEEYNTLSVKFLFLVSNTAFDKKLKAEYPIWLRQIAQYFDNQNLCLHIVGHSSRTGKLGYNCRLSLDRAQAIQKQLQPYFSGIKANSKTDGKAWIHNIAGTGTDDAQDAVDRRVEFKVATCPVSDNRNRDNKIKDCINTAEASR